MSLLNDALAQAGASLGELDLAAVSARIGLPEGQIEEILRTLGAAQPGEDAVGLAAERTGTAPDAVRALLTQIGAGDGQATVGDLLGSDAGLGDIGRGLDAPERG